MLDMSNEQLLTLRDAARALPGQRCGRRVHVSTLYRWCSRGLGGVQLECLRVGGRLYTSQEALQRFADRLTAAQSPGGRPGEPTRDTQRRVRRANAELDEAGF